MENVKSGRRKLHAPTETKEATKDNGEVQISKKWTEEEKKKILYCLKVYGHKDVDKIKEELPGRSREEIRKFLIFVHATARQKQSSKSNLSYWLNKSISEMEKCKIGKMNYFHQSAQIMKFLSIDKFLEDHPVVKSSKDIDFTAAYRLLYQALMGYPLQPVNEATAAFICESLTELNEQKDFSFISDLTELLKSKYQRKQKNNKLENCEKTDGLTVTQINKRVYGKKRHGNEMSDTDESCVSPLKVFIAEEGENSSSNSKYYSLAIGDGEEMSTVVVPISTKNQLNELENAASYLWKNMEFNPLGLSREWC